VKAAHFDYGRPARCGEAVAQLRQGGGGGKYIAGGQSLGPMMNLRLVQPDLLVDLRAIDALRECRTEDGYTMLGALTTHAAIEDGLALDPTRGMMPWVAHGIAYRAVRNRGTLGGSLSHADPAADWVNLMAVLDAQYLVEGPAGARTIDQPDWILGAFTTALHEDEILTGIRIPALSADSRWSYYKFNRKAGEFAEAIAAFVDDPQRGVRRGVIGALAGAPYVICDASPLIDAWDDAFAHEQLVAAGLEPDSYDYKIHAVALARAAHAVKTFRGVNA